MTAYKTPVFTYFPAPIFPFTTDVSHLTTLDPNSAAICSYLRSKLSFPGVSTGQDLPIYYVPATQPMVPVSVTYSYEPWAPFIEQVPIPSNAVPSTGADHYLIIVQGDTLWELWQAAKGTSWSCVGGMRRQHIQTGNPGYSRNVQTPSGTVVEQPSWGVAASRLSLTGGVVQIAELLAGTINHAIAMQVPWSRKGQWAFPAQATDGTDTNVASIPEGAHFRIDPTVNLATLGLTAGIMPFAVAAQKYGIIVNDQTASGVGFAIENGSQYSAIVGSSFWTGQWANLYEQSFPWAHLQLLPMDLRTAADNTLYIQTAE